MYSEVSKGEPTLLLHAKYIDRRRLESYLEALLPHDAKSFFVVERKLDHWFIKGPFELEKVRSPRPSTFDLF